ncbi:hypothetical protein LZ023_19895 [Pseudomonas silvicola]|nr:hypothetical protein LZ023_19895 [Pseudomonas silvicola]
MSDIKIGTDAHIVNDDRSLDQDLVRQLNAILGDQHTASDCWQSANGMLVESCVWLLIAAAIWVVTLVFLG